jgi:chromosome segregation ATPase
VYLIRFGQNPALKRINSRKEDLAKNITRLNKQIAELEQSRSGISLSADESKNFERQRKSLVDTLAKNQALLIELNKNETDILSRGPLARYKLHQEDERSLKREEMARNLAQDKLAIFEKHNPTTKSLEAQLREKEIERRKAEVVLNKHQSQLDKDVDAYERAHDALADLSPEKVANSTAVSSASRSPASGSGGNSEVSRSPSCQELMRNFLKSTLRLSTRTAIY